MQLSDTSSANWQHVFFDHNTFLYIEWLDGCSAVYFDMICSSICSGLDVHSGCS